MEGSKGSEYRYNKVYLYPLAAVPGFSNNPCGTAEIEVFKSKGLLRCFIKDGIGQIAEKYPGCQFYVALRKEGEKEGTLLGRLRISQSGCGEFNWEFNTAGGESERTKGSVRYEIVVTFREDENISSGQGRRGSLMEGRFLLPSEAQDTRILGFKKDTKTNKNCHPVVEGNPLFHRVEPFFPPIPDTIWWRISIHPGFRAAYLEEEYCPKQKSYKAVF